MTYIFSAADGLDKLRSQILEVSMLTERNLLCKRLKPNALNLNQALRKKKRKDSALQVVMRICGMECSDFRKTRYFSKDSKTSLFTCRKKRREVSPIAGVINFA